MRGQYCRKINGFAPQGLNKGKIRLIAVQIALKKGRKVVCAAKGENKPDTIRVSEGRIKKYRTPKGDGNDTISVKIKIEHH